MLTFVHKGQFFCGPSAMTPLARVGLRPEGAHWVKSWAGGAQNSGGRMRPGRARTLAVMARALNLTAAGRRPTKRATKTVYAPANVG